MVSRLPKINHDGEVDDLSNVDQSSFRPAAEVLTPALYDKLVAMNAQAKHRGRPKAAVTKELISIRLSAEVVSAFRESGRGWQTKIDNVLKEWLASHHTQ